MLFRSVARKFTDAVKRTAGIDGDDESGITIEQSDAPPQQGAPHKPRGGPPPKPHRGQGGPGGPRVFHKGKPKGPRS